MHAYAGVDVAKDVHWVCVIDEGARVLLDRALHNTQDDVDALAGALRGMERERVVGLDAMGWVAAFLEAVLLGQGVALVHVPGIAVNRARAGVRSGETKSDPKGARIIAEQVRTRPDLRPVTHRDETTIAIRLLVGRRRDLVEDQTRRISRLRRLIGAVHPGLERALDFTTLGPLHLATRFVTPIEIRAAGRSGLLRHLNKRSGLPQRDLLADKALAAAKAQRTVVPGESPKHVFFQNVFCAVSTKDPLSRAFYEGKRREGKHHTQALVALARHRVTVLSTMLKHRTAFDPKYQKAA